MLVGCEPYNNIYQQAALQYLRRLKPLDGFSVEKYIASSGKNQVRLKRRWDDACP